MNFVDVPSPLQVEVSEENPIPDSDIAPEERPNHLHVEQMEVIFYRRPSGTAQGGLERALETIERRVS